MSEGPEVRRTADRLAAALLDRRIERVELRRRAPLEPALLKRLEGARVRDVRTYGKHLVIAFSRGVWLHDHMTAPQESPSPQRRREYDTAAA